MQKSLVRRLALMGIICTLSASCVPKKDLFRFQFRKGDAADYKGSSTMSVEIKLGPMSETSSIIQEFSYSQQILSVDSSGVAQEEVKFTRLAMTYDLPMIGARSYDSIKDADTADPAFAPLKHLVNNPFVLHIDPRGKVLKVRGFDKIIDQVLLSLGGMELNEQARQFIKTSFSEKMIADIFENTSPLLPINGINVGESWDAEHNVTLPGLRNIKTKYRYTYLSKERGVAKISMRGVMYSEGENGRSDAELMIPMEFKNGDADGTVLFNLKKGIIDHFSSTQVVRVGIKPGPMQFAGKGGQKITIKTEITRVK